MPELHELKELMAIADKCFASGAYIKALEVYAKIVQKYNYNIEACLNYSNLLKALGRQDDALKELKRGLAIGPNNYKILCNMGFLLRDMGRPHDAKDVLLKALENNPQDEHAWNNLGNIYYDFGQLEEAREAYEKAIRLNPDFETAKTNLNNTKRRMGLLDMRPPGEGVAITGTCAKCKGRFRFDCRDVLNASVIPCPHCGLILDDIKLKVFASGLLRQLVQKKED